MALAMTLALGCKPGAQTAPDPATRGAGPVAAAAPDLQPAGPCLPVESADLVERLGQLPFAAKDGGAALVPVTRGSPRWMAGFNAALAWVNDDCPAFAEFAKQMGYKAREIVDVKTGHHHWLLSEEAGRYNGTFVFRVPSERDRARPLSILAPHLGSDFSDGRAATLYRETEATVLLLNAAHRCGLSQCSGCQLDPGLPGGRSGPNAAAEAAAEAAHGCGGCARASDLAHSVDHLMMAVYSSLEAVRKDLRFEYHAVTEPSREPKLEIEGCPATVYLGQGSRQPLLPVEDDGTYPSRLWHTLQARLGERCVCYHQRQTGCLLPGTGSVFGRLTNEEPGRPFDPCGQPSTRLSRRYVHFESSAPVADVAAALREAVPKP